jgi:hypothetical protein
MTFILYRDTYIHVIFIFVVYIYILYVCVTVARQLDLEAPPYWVLKAASLFLSRSWLAGGAERNREGQEEGGGWVKHLESLRTGRRHHQTAFPSLRPFSSLHPAHLADEEEAVTSSIMDYL